VAGLALATLTAAVASAGAEPATTAAGFALHGGGYLQPQVRLRADDPVAAGDEDGLLLRRARVLGRGERTVGRLAVTARIEADLAPDVRLLDASVAAGACLIGGGAWQVEVGRFRVPVSRQALLPEDQLGFVDKPELASLAPARQVGAMATIVVPNAPMARLSAGLWNGDGADQSGDLAAHRLVAGRFEVRAVGADAALAEGALGAGYLWIGASLARGRRALGDGREVATTLGADLAFAAGPLWGTAEYLQVDHGAVTSVQPAFRANGVVAQVGGRLPLAVAGRLELALRFEEIDRNDTVPILDRGDPAQSLRYYTGGASWYLAGHALKLQLSASHIVEVEDRTADGARAAYHNDTVLMQVTAGGER
jgi:hypothetical protein